MFVVKWSNIDGINEVFLYFWTPCWWGLPFKTAFWPFCLHLINWHCYIAGVFPATACPFIGWIMVTWHLTMKLFPAKCHERATLRKLWRQTGNSSLLPAKCWPLLHVITGISARFSNFAFVLFCYTTNHLMTGPLGNSEFCFPRISMFPETIFRKQNSLFSRDQSLSVKCYMRLTYLSHHTPPRKTLQNKTLPK